MAYCGMIAAATATLSLEARDGKPNIKRQVPRDATAMFTVNQENTHSNTHGKSHAKHHSCDEGTDFGQACRKVCVIRPASSPRQVPHQGEMRIGCQVRL